jgi:hypothetical protein
VYTSKWGRPPLDLGKEANGSNQATELEVVVVRSLKALHVVFVCIAGNKCVAVACTSVVYIRVYTPWSIPPKLYGSGYISFSLSVNHTITEDLFHNCISISHI